MLIVALFDQTKCGNLASIGASADKLQIHWFLQFVYQKEFPY